MSKLSYENEDGFTVFTGEYHRNRGTCCRANCLHCPYGTTLKNLGLEFKEVHCLSTANKIIEGKKEVDALTSSLLGSAFGSKPKKASAKVDQSNIANYKFVFLKEVLCAVVEISDNVLRTLHLKEEFEDQGLTKDVVASYL